MPFPTEFAADALADPLVQFGIIPLQQRDKLVVIAETAGFTLDAALLHNERDVPSLGDELLNHLLAHLLQLARFPVFVELQKPLAASRLHARQRPAPMLDGKGALATAFEGIDVVKPEPLPRPHEVAARPLGEDHRVRFEQFTGVTGGGDHLSRPEVGLPVVQVPPVVPAVQRDQHDHRHHGDDMVPPPYVDPVDQHECRGDDARHRGEEEAVVRIAWAGPVIRGVDDVGGQNPDRSHEPLTHRADRGDRHDRQGRGEVNQFVA